jgi:hypothetical protein
VLFIFVFSEVNFKPLGKFAPGEHNASPAALAFKPDIRTETGNGPLVGAAWMLFAESQVIVEAQVGEHIQVLAVNIIN